MTRLIRALVPLFVLALAASPAFPQAGKIKDDKLPPKEQIHVYLLMGQSNMAGRGEVRLADRDIDRGILMLTRDNTWEPAAEPLHFDKPGIAGVGPGLAFGRRMKEAVGADITIALVPCAVGGTPLKRWERGGDLYQAALNRARRAMKDGTLKGILWHQGENDAVQGALAATYGARLAQMIKDFRADLDHRDIPFVCARLGTFLPLENYPYGPIVDKALGEIPSKVPHTACVETDGLKAKSDRVHFNDESARTLGYRYADAIRGLQSKAAEATQTRSRLR
jgi:hypothetical protein